MDRIDKEILNIIQNSPKITNVEMARQLKMAPSGILERVKKLEASGVIEGYEVKISPREMGLALTTFIQVETDDAIGTNTTGRKIAALEGVQEVYLIAGKYCYFVKARVKDTDAHNELMKKLGSFKSVRNARTTLVLETIKETFKLDFE